LNLLSLTGDHFGNLWRRLVKHLLATGSRTYPRGFDTREILNVQLHLTDPYANVLVNPVRNLSYRFMVAEWLWIYFGQDDVKTIKQYNPNIAQFSDNGIDFNGAYGKAIKPHWDRILDTLNFDNASRQAVISIYRAPTYKSKNVPCTIALQWLIRNGCMHCIATMRSSDVWLGLPYDVFNFTMLTHMLSSTLSVPFESFTINLGSSHLYERNFAEASSALAIDVPTTTNVMRQFEDSIIPSLLQQSLMGIDIDPQLLKPPWSYFHHLLHAPTNKKAFEILNERLTEATKPG
jgi:thymidylate synthase